MPPFRQTCGKRAELVRWPGHARNHFRQKSPVIAGELHVGPRQRHDVSIAIRTIVLCPSRNPNDVSHYRFVSISRKDRLSDRLRESIYSATLIGDQAERDRSATFRRVVGK